MQADQSYLEDLVATCGSASRFLWLYVARALAGSPGSTPVSGGSVASARTNLGKAEHGEGREQKGNDCVSCQTLRAEELKAIQKALVQLCSADSQAKAVAWASSFLRARVRAHSKVLMALAQRAASDPLGKVEKMIKDLI
eukprot:7649447-Heterocapsa_arctica.AAC.1